MKNIPEMHDAISFEKNVLKNEMERHKVTALERVKIWKNIDVGDDRCVSGDEQVYQFTGWIARIALTKLAEKHNLNPSAENIETIGFDFLKYHNPIFYDENITIDYKIIQIEINKNQRVWADLKIANQNNELVLETTHCLQCRDWS